MHGQRNTGGGALSYTGKSNKTPTEKTPWNKDYFPNPTLLTQDGLEVRFFDDLIEDKVVAINFIFTSFGYSCPLETSKLRNVQEILGRS